MASLKHWGWNKFKFIFFYENCCILIPIWLQFVLKGPINNKSVLGSDNGLVSNMWQAITWTNNGLVKDSFTHHSASMKETETKSLLDEYSLSITIQ